MTTEVHNVTKHSQTCNRQNCSKSNNGRSQSHDKNGKKCSNCGCTHPPKQCPVYGVECFKCKKKNHFSRFCRSSCGTQKTHNPKCFSRKYVHEVENSGSAKFEYDTESVEFKCIQFMTPMFESSQVSQNFQNIMFDEMSTLLEFCPR